MKENKQSLNLSSKEAISCVKGLIRYLKDKYRKEGFKIKTYAYKEESIFRSYSAILHNEQAELGVGIKELFKPTLLDLPSNFKKIKDIDFVSTVVGIFHESRHLDARLIGCKNFQDVGARGDITKADNYCIQLSYMARDGNNCYYKNNYDNMISEIDAEYYAINMAYEYLKNNFPNVDCEKLVVDYVNNRIQSGPYKIDYIDEKYSSLLHINKAFKDRINQSKKTHRHIDFNCSDQAISLINNTRWNDIKKQIYDISQNNNDECGFKTDEMLAALTFYLSPEYTKSLPGEWQKKLSPKEVFGLDEYPLEDWEIDRYSDYNH